jgi:hypothetical protein
MFFVNRLKLLLSSDLRQRGAELAVDLKEPPSGYTFSFMQNGQSGPAGKEHSDW